MFFHQTLLSQQVKKSTIINNKRGIYDLPREFPNDFKTYDLRELGNVRKI